MHRIVLGLVLALGFLATGCGAKTAPTPSVPATAQLQAAKGVNDVSTAVIAANKAGKVSDAITARVLTINKQVLDVIRDNPVTFRQLAADVIVNARQALPPDLQASVSGYLDDVARLLAEVR